MRTAVLLLCGAIAFAVPAPVSAEPVIGIVAPSSGPNAPLGEQIRAGAAAGAAETGAELVFVEDGCTAESGAMAADRLLRENVAIAIGFVCTESAEAALPILAEVSLPLISPFVRTDGLTDRRERTGYLFYRLAPRADAEHEAVARILVDRWRREFFAIIDDGTIYGRELAESLRGAAETAGLAPVFVDTFRPQLDNQIGLVGRLRRAGATHVLVGGDREDIAVIARDAAELNYPLVIAGGEALRAAPGEVRLRPGVLMIAPPEWHELAAPAMLQSLREAGVEPDGYVLPTQAAVELAVIALAVAEDTGQELYRILSQRSFPTVVGTIRFGERGDLLGLEHRLYRFDGARFVPVE